MPANYVLLEKITVGAAGASSVTFSSIPQTGYSDLVVKASLRCTGSDTSPRVQFNATSGNSRFLYGDGSSALSASDGSNMYLVTGVVPSTYTANTFSNVEMYIPNYTSSSNKSSSTDGVIENNATVSYLSLNANLWSNTNAITSITFSLSGSVSFVANSTFYLYGVAKLGTTPAIQAYATGGDIIETDGTYWYHAFLSSGTFTPTKGISCDVLVVAGGGSSGGYNTGNPGIGSGGGGAGGAFYSGSNSLTTTNYTVTIGAGGAGVGAETQGANGSNSTFTGLTSAVGGGGGGKGNGGPGATGGSGGGSNQNGTSAAGTAGQGNAGGAGDGSGSGGGGGGAGGAGVATVSNSGGNGGAGTSSYSSWLSTVGLGVSGAIAGGGGGAAYDIYGPGGTATGGGGRGRGTGGATASGVANTGGGGGGVGTSVTSSSGGSGLVIVRYAV